jgi:hypothetical protein
MNLKVIKTAYFDMDRLDNGNTLAASLLTHDRVFNNCYAREWRIYKDKKGTWIV